jgi:hypothetical protein
VRRRGKFHEAPRSTELGDTGHSLDLLCRPNSVVHRLNRRERFCEAC